MNRKGKDRRTWLNLATVVLVALAFIVVVSLLTKAPDADTVATFDKVKAECKNTK